MSIPSSPSRVLWTLGSFLASSLLALGAATDPIPAGSSARRVDFATEIEPLLTARCHKCHGPQKAKGGFRLDTRERALAGGDNHAPAIKPGDGQGSPLFRILAGLDPDLTMPPDSEGPRLTQPELDLLRAWIDQGATWSPTAAAIPDPAAAAPTKHWAFLPVGTPKPPTPNPPAATAATPIDAFIGAALTRQGLTFSPEADRLALIRRLWLIVLGVPPTPDEVDRFEADRRPDAFERWVDQALADPRYGERWARHWLDVVRFAESNGFETNRERPNAWRFRDYVIAAFNDDKPYHQFVREQIAGDSLGQVIATGFLVGGPVDIVGSPDPALTAQQRADELDDMVSTTSSAFLGLSLGCARCHAHKFDPIPQREYYAMAALFAGVKHGERPLPSPPPQDPRVQALDQRIAKLESRLSPYLDTVSATAPASQTPQRPAVNARLNEETFEPTEARWVRFVVESTSGGEPCLDELEIWSGTNNVALAARGARARASGTLPGFAIHQVEHIHDGRTGNDHSWISNESGRGWIEIELPHATRIERILWSRDRTGRFADRVATGYRIDVAAAAGAWRTLVSSADRQPFPGAASKGPRYRLEALNAEEAARVRDWIAELDDVRRERESAAKPPMAYAGTFVEPATIHRLHRGDPMQKREVVAPGTLGLFAPVALSAQEPEARRRARLADWLTDPRNPLTARVFVNRVWQHHFGVGLVETPNDFGLNGARPTHPELLDWLARDFMDHGWSVKHLQRRILTSVTWRQSSTPRPDGLRIDAGSRWLWRFPPRRLEAEAIRDSILAVTGALDRRSGGPSFHLHAVDRENVYHYHPKERFETAEFRRMIYAFKVRMEQDAIFGAFDCPDGSLVAPKRSVSTTPLQALNLFNSRFVVDQSAIFADRLARATGPSVNAQIERAWREAFGRRPTAPEATAAAALASAQGVASVCRALLNANEFVFIP